MTDALSPLQRSFERASDVLRLSGYRTIAETPIPGLSGAKLRWAPDGAKWCLHVGTRATRRVNHRALAAAAQALPALQQKLEQLGTQAVQDAQEGVELVDDFVEQMLEYGA